MSQEITTTIPDGHVFVGFAPTQEDANFITRAIINNYGSEWNAMQPNAEFDSGQLESDTNTTTVRVWEDSLENRVEFTKRKIVDFVQDHANAFTRHLENEKIKLARVEQEKMNVITKL
jgi:hypothetical protein